MFLYSLVLQQYVGLHNMFLYSVILHPSLGLHTKMFVYSAVVIKGERAEVNADVTSR